MFSLFRNNKQILYDSRFGIPDRGKTKQNWRQDKTSRKMGNLKLKKCMSSLYREFEIMQGKRNTREIILQVIFGGCWQKKNTRKIGGVGERGKCGIFMGSF